MTSPDLIQPSADQFNLGWSEQMSPRLSLDVDYIHAYGRKQLSGIDPNLPPTGPLSATNPRPVSQVDFERLINEAF